ncbi:gamma-glutamyl-gamma-aminobutyrate hydrolase family protein [Halomicrobium sp. IBSBa]|uniref:type 1 glutamine amidotransferase n=1 Tax=Halomicrobium sp. IBSBa TaxID=2778916 RepID=UPI001ABEE926|nr:type 1 glutamine amidotransferase [Halomicrobium sp. IBSBa]MBO4247933.1 gamma-glutamyl-gamma-aminobutyrate hydrolase family protein [Halomicrobium sp. IBSBa]
MSLRIALLNAAHDGALNRRNFRRELDADLVEYDVTERELPDTFAFDGCLLTGSRASVYWEEPWIADLTAWVRNAVDRDVAFLGVCFGHQLLAHALGGEVEPMDEYEIGYRTVEHDGTSELLDGVDDRFTVFTTHSDRVVELPPEAEQFAANDYGIHGFQTEDVFSVQFHPEYDPETAREVTRGKDEQLSEARIKQVLDGITAENYDAACEAKRLFDNFTQYLRERATTGESGGVAAADD